VEVQNTKCVLVCTFVSLIISEGFWVNEVCCECSQSYISGLQAQPSVTKFLNVTAELMGEGEGAYG
jgi:hypothetical protein